MWLLKSGITKSRTAPFCAYIYNGHLGPWPTISDDHKWETLDLSLDVKDTEPSLVLHPSTKPGCKSRGYSPLEESKQSWRNFKTVLQSYVTFHREQLQRLQSGDRMVRTLTWSCYDQLMCAGIGDQLYRIQESLVYAIVFKRLLLLHWNPASYETMKYLRPNKINWTYFNRSQGMHEYHDAELNNIVAMENMSQFEPLYDLLASNTHTHVTLNHELKMPFLRGMCKAVENEPRLREVLESIGFTSLITDRTTGVSLDVLSGELFRYLFHFSHHVVNKVDHIQRQLGIHNQPYLAVHVRTGFADMEQEECKNHFCSYYKVYRSTSDWETSLACSVDLADELFGPGAPIILVTDSNKVKQLAASEHGKRFQMINVTLQHVALTDIKKSTTSFNTQQSAQNIEKIKPSISPPTNNIIHTSSSLIDVNGIDGYMATWIEFLLIARASAVHHSISGFSSTAAQFCSVHKQYRVPNCEKW